MRQVVMKKLCLISFSDERVDNSNVASVSSLHTVVLGIIH